MTVTVRSLPAIVHAAPEFFDALLADIEAHDPPCFTEFDGERVVFSADSHRLALATRYLKKVKVWDINTGKLLHDMPMAKSRLLVFSPDAS